MAVNYDDVIKQNKRNLTRAQIQALAKAANKYSAENAGNRADALASLRNQYDTGYRGLQNMGLAGGLEAQATSGEVPRLGGQIQDAFDKYNQSLKTVEHQRLTALGTKYANATKRARAEAALKQQQAALAAAEAAQAAFRQAKENQELSKSMHQTSTEARGLSGSSINSAPLRQRNVNMTDTGDSGKQQAPVYTTKKEALAAADRQAREQAERAMTARDVSSTAAQDEKMAIMRAKQDMERARRAAAAELLGVSTNTKSAAQTASKREIAYGASSDYARKEQMAIRRVTQAQQELDESKAEFEKELLAWNQKVTASEHYEDKSQFKVQSGSTSASNLKRGINTNMTDTASNRTNAGSTNKYAPQGTTYVRDAEDNRTPLNRDDEPESLVRAREKYEQAEKKLRIAEGKSEKDTDELIRAERSLRQNDAGGYDRAADKQAYEAAQKKFEQAEREWNSAGRSPVTKPGQVTSMTDSGSEQRASEFVGEAQNAASNAAYQKYELAKQERDAAQLKYENPKLYAAYVVAEDPDASPELREAAAKVLMKSWGFEPDERSEEQFQADKKTVAKYSAYLAQYDDAETPEEKNAAEVVLKSMGVTPDEAREFIAKHKQDRSGNAEYDYYKNALMNQLTYAGKAPKKPVNEQEQDDLYRAVNQLDPISKTPDWMYDEMSPYYRYGEQYEVQELQYLTDDERNAYNYIYETKGLDAANKYIKDGIVLRNIRAAAADEESARALAEQSPIIANLISVATNSLGNVPAMLEKLVKGTYNYVTGGNNPLFIDTTNSLNRLADYGNTIRDETSRRILEANEGTSGKIYNFFYQSGMSMADSVTSMLFASTVGSWITDVMFFSSAGNAAYEDAIRRGATQEQALSASFLSGFAESFFEHASIEHFLNLDYQGKGRIIKNMLSQAGVEASEEVCTEIANILSDAFVMRDKAKEHQAAAEHQKKLLKDNPKMDPNDAKREAYKKALLDELLDIFMSGVGGGISGLGFGVSGAVLNTVSQTSTGKEAKSKGLVEGYIRNAQLLGGDAAKLATEVNGSKDPGSRLVGAMVQQVNTEVKELAKTPGAGAAMQTLLTGKKLTTNGAGAVMDALGADALQEMGYDTSSASAFAKSYNARLQEYNITPRMQETSEARQLAQVIPDRTHAKTPEFGGEELARRQANAEQNAVTAARANAANQVWANPEQGLTLTSEGRTVPAMPGNMTAISFAEQERNNFQTRASAKTGNVTYAVAGMQAREGLSNEQTLSEIKKGLTKEARQKAEVYEKLSSALGIPMVIHDVMTGTNGFIDEDGNMHVVLSGKQSVLRVAAHELTHWGKNKNASAYSALREHLINEVGDDRFDRMLKQKAKEYGIDLSTEKGKALADDEVCAELCERMLSNEDALEKFAMKNTEAAKSLKDHLVKILNAIKQAFKQASNRDFGDSWSDLIQSQDTIESWIQMLQGAVDKAEHQAQTNEGQIAQTAGITVSEQDAMLEDIHEVTAPVKEAVAEVKAEKKEVASEVKAETKAERDPLKARRYVSVTSTSNRSQGRSFEGGKAPKGMTNLSYKMDNAESFGRKIVTGSMSDYANFGYSSYFGNLDGDAYGYSKNTWRSDNGRAIMDSQAAVSSAADLKKGNAFLDDVVRMNFLSSEELGNAGSMKESDVANRAPVKLPSLTQEQKQAAADVAKMLAKGKQVVLQLPVSDNFDGMSRATLGAIFDALPARKRTGISFATGLTGSDIAKAGDVNLVITDESQQSQGDDMTWTSLAATTADRVDDVIAEHSVDIFEYDMQGYVRDLVSKGTLSKSEMSDLMDTMNKAITMVKAHRAVLDFGFQLSEEAQNDAALAEKEIKEAKQGRAYLPYKQNADPHYKLALDFSTLCRKRVLLQSIQERLQAKLGRALSQEETVAIRLELQNLQRNNKEEFGKIEVACALCYVEAARLKSPKVINTFLNNTKSEMQNYFAKKNPASKKIIEGMQQQWKVDHGYAPDATKKEMSSSDVTAFNTFSKNTREQFESDNAAEQATVDRATRLTKGEKVMIGGIEFPGRETFLSASWLEKLKGVEPDIFYAFTDKVRSATRSKAQETDTFYARGDIDMVTEGILNYANAESGFRHQSWSDFVPTHLLDTMASVIEMSTRDAKMHAYTKVPSMVRLLGNTGMMLNMSLIPAGNTGIDANGNLSFDSVEGMPWDDMMKLRDMFPNTAGNIAIGINDEQIKLMLASGDIDYVIPYHASGMNKNMRGYLDIRAWSEYTSSQNEKTNHRGQKGATPELKEWFDEKAAAKAEDGNALMRAASEKYLQLCYERNLVPKFSQYLKNNGDGSYSLKEGYENYWKMLTDRKMVNQITGKVIIQQAVKPMFDQATVIDILQDRVNDPAIQQQAKAADLVTEKFSGWQANQNNASAEAIAEAKKIRDRTNAITAQKTAEESGMRHSLDTDAIREAMSDNDKVRYSLDSTEHRKAAIKPKGKNPVRDIDVPEVAANGKRVSDFTRSALESNKFTDEMVEQLMPAVEAGEWGGYTRLTNEEAMNRAKDYIAKHQTVKAQQDFHDMVMSGQYNVNTRALGLQLLTEAAQRGDKLAVLDIATDLRILATDAGQSVQIFSVLKDLGGVGSAYYMNRVVERLNTKYADQIASGDMNEITVSEDLMNQLERAQSTREVQAAEKAISKEIADQLPLTWADRLSNWRYMAMLANPTTHVRNLFGNLLMGGMVSAKDIVATGIERAAIKDKSAWTHAVLSKADRQMFGKIAEDSYLDNEALLRGNGKFSFENEIKQNMRSFDTKALNAVAQFNFNKLEQEDMWFIKPAYKNALMQYMKAQGYTVKDGKVGKMVSGEFKEMTKAQKAQAFEYASEQAWKATFHDASALADLLNKVSRMNTASRLIVEGVMPFKKTPINIAKRGIEYSPAGIVIGLVQLGRDVKNGKVTTAHAVDNLASGLTGTTLMALGALLAKMKLIKAEGDDDDKKKSTYLSDTGDQTYSLKIGKYSFGLSALAPATIPLFMGAALWEKISGQDENLDLSTITDVVSGALNPFMEMSFMSSLNSALKNYGNEGIGGALGNSILTAAENYGSQYLPTLTSKLGQFFDPTVRTTKSSATSPIGSGMDYYARSLVKKTPGLEATLQPDINVWGRKTEKGNILTKDGFQRWALDFANKFILPTNVKVANRDAVDDELIRVMESTGNTDFLPSDGPKKFKVKGEDYKMNAAQYTQYSEDRGTASYAALKETMSLNAYQTADDETKASMLSNALEAAQKQVNSVWKEKLGAFEPKQTVEATTETATAQEKPQESVKDIQGDYSDPALYKVAAQYPNAYDKAAKAKSLGVSPDTFLDIYEKRDNYLGENLAQYTRQEIMNSNLTTKQKELMDDLIVSDKGWNPDYSSQTWFDISQLDKTKERKRYNQAKEGSKIGVKPETYLKVYTAWANMHGSDKQKQAKQYLDSLAITAPAYDYFWYTVFEYTKHPSKVK